MITEVWQALVIDGIFLVHVPSFYCERWRAGIHSHKKYNNHYWTFGIINSEVPKGLKNYLEIDDFLRQYFEIKMAEYCGDDGIFIYCVKK